MASAPGERTCSLDDKHEVRLQDLLQIRINAFLSLGPGVQPCEFGSRRGPRRACAIDGP